MIRSFYHHGAEVPATNLTREQMRAAMADAGGVLWVDMVAPEWGDAERILTRVFGFHPLTISDCLQGVRRPKLDSYGDYIFLVIYAGDQTTLPEEVSTVELDMYLGSNFVVTHHPLPLPAIDRIVERVMREEFAMARGADVLAYEILHAVASDYQPAVDFLSAAVAGVEVEILTAPTSKTLHRMHELRHDILKVRRVMTPQQDIVTRLATQEFQPIDAANRVYFRNVTDRFAQMVETTDELSQSIGRALQTHLSVVSNQTNSLLRFIAAMVTILLPVTLLAVLGETGVRTLSAAGLPYADAVVAGATLLLALLLALYLYRRSW